TSTRILRSVDIWLKIVAKPKSNHGDTETRRNTILKTVGLGPVWVTAAFGTSYNATLTADLACARRFSLSCNGVRFLRGRFSSLCAASPCLRDRFFLRQLQASPQVPRGKAAVGMPGFGDLLNLLRRGRLALAIEPLNGHTHAKIARGQDVGPAQGEHEEHVGGPYADAFDVSKRGDYLLIGHLGQFGEIHLAADGMLGQIADVTQLLTRKTGAPHLAHAQVLDGLRSERASGGFFQAAVDGPRGFAAELLENDGPGQHFKSRLAIRHLAGANTGNNRGKDCVGFFEMVNGSFHGQC